MLTDADCKNAACPPDKKQARIYDTGGLYLQISPSGSKRWFLKYRIAEKEKQLALGAYPTVSLKAARRARDEAKRKKAEQEQAAKLPHAGMTGDHHAESVDGQGLAHECGQLRLFVGVGLEKMLHAQPFQHPAQGDGLGDFVEVAARGRVILVAGHGGGAVFHNHQGQPVVIEQGVDDTGNTGMEEGGVAEEGDYPAAVIMQGQPSTDTGGGTHAEQHLTHAVGILTTERMAADVGHGDGLIIAKGLFDGMKGAAMAASRTHLGRPWRQGWLKLLRNHTGWNDFRPGAMEDSLHLVRGVLANPIIHPIFSKNAHG